MEGFAKSPVNRFADWLGWGFVFLGAGIGAFLGVVAYVQHWISCRLRIVLRPLLGFAGWHEVFDRSRSGGDLTLISNTHFDLADPTAKARRPTMGNRVWKGEPSAGGRAGTIIALGIAVLVVAGVWFGWTRY